MVADNRVPRRLQADGVEGTLGLRQQPGVPRRVDVGPVVVRIRVRRRLDSLVAGRAAVRVDAAAAQDRQRLVKLVQLVVVDQVAGLDHGLRMKRVQRAHHRVEHVPAQRLLRPEGRRERSAAPVEQLEPGRRLLVDDVRVGQLREQGEPLDRLRRRRELGAVDERLAARALEHAVAVAVAERRVERGAGRRPAAARDQQHREQRKTGSTHLGMVPEATGAAAEPPPPVPTSLSLLVLERGEDVEPRRAPGRRDGGEDPGRRGETGAVVRTIEECGVTADRSAFARDLGALPDLTGRRPRLSSCSPPESTDGTTGSS